MYNLVKKLIDALIILLAKRILCASDFGSIRTGTQQIRSDGYNFIIYLNKYVTYLDRLVIGREESSVFNT
jgi:hypothetical protein